MWRFSSRGAALHRLSAQVAVVEPQAAELDAVEQIRPLAVGHDELGRTAADVDDARQPVVDREAVGNAEMDQPRFFLRARGSRARSRPAPPPGRGTHRRCRLRAPRSSRPPARAPHRGSARRRRTARSHRCPCPSPWTKGDRAPARRRCPNAPSRGLLRRPASYRTSSRIRRRSDGSSSSRRR